MELCPWHAWQGSLCSKGTQPCAAGGTTGKGAQKLLDSIHTNHLVPQTHALPGFQCWLYYRGLMMKE